MMPCVGAEDGLEPPVRVLEGLAAGLARRVRRNELHRPRPVERDERDDVLEARRRRLRDEVAHAARFELEHRRGVGRPEDVVGGLVVERQRLERELARGIEALHVAQRPVEDRERGETEEVELDEADRLDVVLVELRDDRVRARLRVQRAEIGELARRDQHAACVHADVAGETFERFGERQELADFLLLLLALGDAAARPRGPGAA